MKPDPQVSRVPRDRLIPHPLNPNEMTAEEAGRLRSGIAMTGRYPAILVRSLECSAQWEHEHALGQLQILDGHQRDLRLAEMGEEDTRRIEIWPGITDAVAEILIGMFNHGGSDNPDRRAKLIRAVQERASVTDEDLSRYFLESTEDLAKYRELSLDEQNLVKVGPAEREAQQAQLFSVFVHPDQHRAITGRIEAWLKEHDPEGTLPYREGAALAALVGVTGLE